MFYERVTFTCGGRLINSWAMLYPTEERPTTCGRAAWRRATRQARARAAIAREAALRSADLPVLRFAPSPNGALHLGHALSALTGFDDGAPPRRPLPAAHRGHRRRPQPARSTSPASSRISPGSASPGSSRCCANREHFAVYAAAARPLEAMGAALSLLCDPRRDRGGGRSRRRSIPTARRSIRVCTGMSAAEIARRKRARRAVRAAPRHGARRWRLARTGSRASR